MPCSQRSIRAVINKLVQAWDDLEVTARNGNADPILKTALSKKWDNKLFAGYDVSKGRRLLILRSKPEILEKVKRVQEREYFVVSIDNSDLVLELLDPELSPLFNALSAWVAERVLTVNTQRQQAAEFRASIRKWLDAHDPPVNEALSEPKQRGLYAELWFLRKYILPVFEPTDAIMHWSGPAAKDQDFQFKKCCVEVKAATIRNEGVRISNEHQLEIAEEKNGLQTIEHRELFLFCLFLSEEESGQGETLYEIIENVRNSIAKSSAACFDFQTKLAKMGYRKKHEDEYKSVRRVVAKGIYPSFYRVEDRNEMERFPRIVAAALPIGVHKVKYWVRFADIQKFVADEAEVIVRVTAGAPCAEPSR